MLRAALFSTLLSAGIASAWVAYAVVTGRRRANGIADERGPRFELLAQ